MMGATTSPLLSICIPNYNMGKTLVRAVRSALAVTPFEIVEVVVVDNASTDHSRDVVEQYRRMQRLKVVLADGHLSMEQNWDRAVEASTGQWCVILCADDELVPNFLTNIRSELTNPIAPVVSQYAEIRGAEELGYPPLHGDTSRRSYTAATLAPVFHGGWNVFPLSTTCFTRALHRQLRGFSYGAPGLIADAEFWARVVFEAGDQIVAAGWHGGYYYPAGGSWASGPLLHSTDFLLLGQSAQRVLLGSVVDASLAGQAAEVMAASVLDTALARLNRLSIDDILAGLGIARALGAPRIRRRVRILAAMLRLPGGARFAGAGVSLIRGLRRRVRLRSRLRSLRRRFSMVET